MILSTFLNEIEGWAAMKIFSLLILCLLLCCPAASVADDTPLVSSFGTTGANTDSNAELGGVPVAYANTTTTGTVSCSAGSISSTSIGLSSSTNFDSTGGTAAVCNTSGKCNVFTYTSISGSTMNGIANAAAGQIPTCTSDYGTGARIYSMTSATNLAHRLTVLMSAIRNTQQFIQLYGEFFVPASLFSTDGTQCAAPTEAILATSKPKTWSITCTDNDAGRMETHIGMPIDWDGLAIYVRPYWYTTSTQAAKNIVQSFSGQCVRAGDTVANVATTGEQNVTVTLGTSANEEANAETPAITLQGTCAATADVYLTGEIDATGTTITTIANARFIGAKVRYGKASR